MRVSGILFSVLLFISFSQDWSDALNAKVDKVVKSTYLIEDYRLESIRVPNDKNAAMTTLSGKMHKVVVGDEIEGVIYVAQAPSMKNVFDYIVLFDKNYVVTNVKVLIYREQHGRQIGTKRWLSQFFGKTIDDRPELEVDIDGISGATISCRNMTIAMNNLLTSLDQLVVKEPAVYD